MEQYFHDVVSDLSQDDMKLLECLFDNHATVGFKAIRNQEAVIISGLSEAMFRKVVYRLSANKLITTVSQKREHSIYISQYGMAALKRSIIKNKFTVSNI